MTVATTESFNQLVLEVEKTTGVWARLCGLIDVSVSRAASVDSSETPDCDDESLPLSVEKEVRSVEISVSGSGVWAQESHGTMSDWFYSAGIKNVRIGNLNAAIGETEYEQGPALLTKLDNSKTKGQKVSAEIELVFSGTPTRTAKA